MSATSEDPRWSAVLARDPSADGRFWYSVATTGVYCRPSCGARTPNPKNVRFHATQDDARSAGFRPCLRCRPADPPLAERHAALVAAACRRLDREDALLEELASDAGLSPHHFHRVFKAVAGVTPRAYAAERRDRRVRRRLPNEETVADAYLAAGYSSSGRFYARSGAALGMTPSAFRAGGSGETIRFAVGECSLGAVLVAATEAGVCAILLGDDPDALVRDLEDRFPSAELVGGDPSFEETVARVVGLIESPGTGALLPLDVRGTAFQRRVWEALREIPAGTTVSYAELAGRIGAPSATRAVAGACAANPIAVAIPCHRVVRRDGGLSGYRWGVERKRALLAREAG